MANDSISNPIDTSAKLDGHQITILCFQQKQEKNQASKQTSKQVLKYFIVF